MAIISTAPPHTIDYSLGTIFYISPTSSNFRINIINLPSISSSIILTLILNQSSTGYYASTIFVGVNDITSTTLWSPSPPVPSSSKTDIQTITLFYTESTWKALVNYVNYT